MRLMFVCRMLDQISGGVERSAINLMNELVHRGHEISLFTWDRTGAIPFFPMSDSVHWFQMNMGDPWQNADFRRRLSRLRQFRRYVSDRRPHAVIGFQHGAFLFAAVGVLNRRLPVILAERNSPGRMDYLREGHYRRGVFLSMRLARSITVQLESYIGGYPRYLRNRIVAIPNSVNAPAGFAEPGEEKSPYTLLSVGRLSYQKNYEALIRSFAGLEQEFPNWKLRIVGEGESRIALEKLVSQLGLEQRVQMEGHTADVSGEYRSADLFCLPSWWEGFPNTLAEAMAHGLPCVAFEGCAGANELIQNEKNGRLAGGNGDPDSLTPVLRELMSDAGKRKRLGQTARDIALQYEPAQIYDRWEELFLEVSGTR